MFKLKSIRCGRQWAPEAWKNRLKPKPTPDFNPLPRSTRYTKTRANLVANNTEALNQATDNETAKQQLEQY